MQRISIAPGYEISRVIRGGWQLAGGHGAIDEEMAIEDMVAFADAGNTTFDCADIYTGVEDLIGRFRVRYRDMTDTERSYSLEEPGDLPEDFYGPADRLMNKAWEKRQRLRLIAVRLSSLYTAMPSADFFEQGNRERRESVQQVLTEVRAKFGPQALMRGHDALLGN